MSKKQEQELETKETASAAAEGEMNSGEAGDQTETNHPKSGMNSDLDQLLEDQQIRINELEEELERLKEAQLRRAAEMENFKKRLQRERDQVFQTSKEASIEAFLPVYDDLLRTLHALESANADKAYLDGIRLVTEKFEDVLKRYNVEMINETGVPFDVNLHDAMMRQEPEDDSIESGTVLQVFENGYKMGDKTLRHAKVIVSQ
jgi:molecular chaperone GrpE